MLTSRHNAVPAARTHDLVTTRSKDEVLVYDQNSHHIHHLNHTAAAVWELCDGTRTVGDLAQAAAIDEDAVRLALRKLEDAKLLDGPLSTEMRGTVQSRRAFMKKAAIAGAVPVIVSITAPLAALATSPTSCLDMSGSLRPCDDGLNSTCSNQISGCGQCGCGGDATSDPYFHQCVNNGHYC